MSAKVPLVLAPGGVQQLQAADTLVARMRPPAGSTAAASAPLQFTSGSLNTTAEAGAIEFLSDKLYFTITTGAVREELVLSPGLTSGRVPYATTNGRLTDATGLTYDGNQLLVGPASQNVLFDPGGGTTAIKAYCNSTTSYERDQIICYRNNNGGALVNGWYIGTFDFNGYDGTSYYGSAGLAVVVDGTVSTGVMPLSFQFYTGQNNNPTTRLTLTSKGSIVCGNSALATGATDGFLYIPTCSGAPSGTPTAQTGRVAMIFDTSTNNFYIYNGAWKKILLA